MIRIAKCTADKFQEWISEGRKVICFCAGQGLVNWCNRYKMESNILYVVDNYKYGTTLNINGHSVSVISPENIRDDVNESILVITSVNFASELIAQLDNIEILNGLVFYIPALFEKEKSSERRILKGSKEQNISKKIHYCWFGKAEMPQQFKNNILSWEKNCPDYEIIRWDESNYDIEKNLYMKQAYEMKRWGFVPDYARLDIINTYGGVYLDTDVEILRPIDELLYFDFFCGFENDKQVGLGLGFGAKKNFEILKDMMCAYEQIQFINSDGTLNLVASPIYQTEIIEKYGFEINGKMQKIGNSIILSPEYLAPIDTFGRGEPTINSFSIHQYAATWFDERQREKKEEVIEACKWIGNRMVD